MRKTSSTLIAIVLALLSLGIVMLASTSSVRGAASFNDPLYFLKRQLIWLFLSICIAVGISRFDYHWWRKLALPLSVLSGVLLVLVFCYPAINGSHRWLRLGPLSLQPSELAKFAMIVVMARWMSQIGHRARNFKEGLLIPITGLGILLVLLILEPDFGTTLLVGVVGMLLMFVGGTRIGYLLISGVLGGCAFVVAVMQDPIRMKRILAFLMPERFPAEAYHLAQSKIAFIIGGLFGVGLGNSIQKQFYLPEAHTDFILAIIGEEMGFAATAAVVLFFAGILACGLIIGFNAPDAFGKLLAFGITMIITLQAAINIGVVTGCLPTKGLPLPFISYGGSSMMMSIVCVGVLLNVAEHCADDHIDEHTHPIKDLAHEL